MAISFFTVSSTGAFTVAIARLAQTLTVQSEAPTRIQAIFLDTFDRRLDRAGWTLAELESDGDSSIWVLQSTKTTGQFRGAVDGHPRTAAECADHPMGVRVARWIGIRRLLPLVGIRIRNHPRRILDERGKTIARVTDERGLVWDPSLPSVHLRKMPPGIAVHALKGYEAEAKKIATILGSSPGLEAESASAIERALKACGLQPPERRPKPKLSGQLTARQALVVILLNELDTMERNAPGTRLDLDTEFLHDFRVAVRRTRSVLGQHRGILDPRRLERFQREFRWLGERTGPTRDLDVYLLKMPEYRQQLPENCRSDLRPLETFLERRQKEEQGRLAAELGSARYRRLVRDWRKFLLAANSLPPRRNTPNAARPIRDVATARIRKLYRRVLRDGEAIDVVTPGEALHRLRIDCKKLRYLLEFFASLYEAVEVRKFIRSLKSLQDTLGDFQDLEVQQAALEQFGSELPPSTDGAEASLLAMGRLIERLRKAQADARSEFHLRFDPFAAKANRDRFQRLFPKRADRRPA